MTKSKVSKKQMPYFEQIKGVYYSYSAHNDFRKCLLLVIGRVDLIGSNGIKWDELPKEMPFYKLLMFSDCEGCLDWEVSEELLTEFERFDQTAKSVLNKYAYDIYTQWRKTFEHGKDKCVVVFG
jgi:hypothetical protein